MMRSVSKMRAAHHIKRYQELRLGKGKRGKWRGKVYEIDPRVPKRYGNGYSICDLLIV